MLFLLFFKISLLTLICLNLAFTNYYFCKNLMKQEVLLFSSCKGMGEEIPPFFPRFFPLAKFSWLSSKSPLASTKEQVWDA